MANQVAGSQTKLAADVEALNSKIMTDEAATASAYRNVWFSDSTDVLKRVHDTDFQYNPATNDLKVGTINGKTVSDITPGAVSVSPTYNSNITNSELVLRTIGKLVTGYFVFAYNSSFAGGDGMQEIITNNNGLPPSSVGNQMLITCVAGSSAGQTGRVRVTSNGHLQFYYSNLKGKAGETYLVHLDYITA